MPKPRPFYRYLWTGLALVLPLALFWAFFFTSEARAARPLSDGGWLPAASGLTSASPEAKAVSSSSQQIELSFSFSGVQAEPVQLAGQPYTRLSGLELGSAALPGQPELPFLSRDVQIPFKATYTLEITHSEYREVKLAELGLPGQIFPAQVPQTKSGPVPPVSAPDATAYATNGFLPAQPAEMGLDYIQRGRRGLSIELHPVQYNPATGTLRIYSQIDMRIHLTGGDAALTRQMTERYASPEFESLQAATLLNYGLPGAEAAKLLSLPPGYLIITANSYAAGLAPFVTLKQNQGFTVTLATLTDVGGTTNTAIKTYIQNFYNANPSLAYLLLVGDIADESDSIPDSTDSLTSNTTDLYYATLAGSDTIPDIFYGRFPVRDTVQLANMVNKALAYQSASGSEVWVKQAAFIGTSDATYYPLAEGTHNYVIDTYTAPLGYTGSFPANPQPGGDKLYAITYAASTTHVITSINDGRSLVVYSGHGNTTSWAGPTITQPNVRSLLANDIFPYVAGHACLTGKWDVEESFAETWVIQPDQGALVYFGASNNTYWNEDDLLERAIFDNLYGEDQPSIGAMTQYGLLAVNTKYPDRGLYYRQIYHIFGDPSVKLVLGARDFSLAVDPEEIQICSSGETHAVVNLTSINSFANLVDLSLIEELDGISGAFDPAQVTPTGSSLLTLTDAGMAHGTYPLSVQAVSGDLTHTVDLSLTVINGPLSASSLLSPADAATEQWIYPVFEWEAVEGAISYYFELDDADDFVTPLLQASLTEPAYTPALALPSGSQLYWRVLAKNDCGETLSTVFDFTTTSLPPLYLYLPTISN